MLLEELTIQSVGPELTVLHLRHRCYTNKRNEKCLLIELLRLVRYKVQCSFEKFYINFILYFN